MNTKVIMVLVCAGWLLMVNAASTMAGGILTDANGYAYIAVDDSVTAKFGTRHCKSSNAMVKELMEMIVAWRRSKNVEIIAVTPQIDEVCGNGYRHATVGLHIFYRQK